MDLIVDFPRRRPVVSFADHCQVHLIDNLAFKYKDDMWFSRREMDSFRQQILETLRSVLLTGQTMAQYAQSNIEDSSVFQGLENYLQTNTRDAVWQRRERVIRGVLSEQQRQLDSGTYDPEAFAVISSRLSKGSRLRARTIGLIHIENSL